MHIYENVKAKYVEAKIIAIYGDSNHCHIYTAFSEKRSCHHSYLLTPKQLVQF